MTLPPASTATGAIRYFARTLREGVLYNRTPRMKEVREYYLDQLRRHYEEADPVPFSIQFGKADPPLPPMKARQNVKVLFPQIFDGVIPSTWGVRFYERLSWPPPIHDPDKPQHPFRLFLEITRGKFAFSLHVHDPRDKWLGPTFKAKTRIGFYPLGEAGPPLSTYMVVEDKQSEKTLCQWLTVILAQRRLITRDEEEVCLGAFFDGKKDDLDLRLEAYDRMKRRFLQPKGGTPSFSTYYSRTMKGLRAERWIAEQPGVPEYWVEAGDRYISLRSIRASEPQLHRAVLDRIASGKLKVRDSDGVPHVRQKSIDRIDQERRRNAESKVPKTFPGKRAEWIPKLMRRGLSHASATRKLKRWMNTDRLSEQEVEASIQAGRKVRLHRDK